MGKQNGLVLAPCPFQGHINSMLQLGKALHTMGFSITIAHASHNSPNSEVNPMFSFVPLTAEGSSDVSTDMMATLLKVNESCKEAFAAYLSGSADTCAVIADELMFFADDVALGLNVSSLIFRTTSAAVSLARSTIFELEERAYLISQDYSLSNEIIPELHPLRFKDLPLSLTSKISSSVLLRKAFGKRASSAIIWNTTNCLEQSILDKHKQESRIPIFPIGPIHKISPSISSSLIKEDESCVSWLNKHPKGSVIYVSLSGSIATMAEREASEVAWGLANAKLPFLWVIRPSSIKDGLDLVDFMPQEFFEEVGDRGLMVKWAPQKEVLAHGSVGGFWSHCGWNSTLESLSEGVPMICRPCVGDQRVNARYMSHVWRVGFELEGLEREEIERVVRMLIVEDKGKEMRKRAKELKVKIEASTFEDGSSISSLNELAKFIMF